MLGEASVVCNVQEWLRFRMGFVGVRESSYGTCKSVWVLVLDVQVTESERTRTQGAGMIAEACEISLKDVDKGREGRSTVRK